MQRLAIVLLIAAGVVGYAHAADLATDKPPEKPKPKCFASAMDWLNTSASECPMTYAGFQKLMVRQAVAERPVPTFCEVVAATWPHAR